MSIDSVVRSLAPMGAEDETLRNTQSVPAMLKLSKDLLGRHLTVLDQVVSHFSVEDKLSTYSEPQPRNRFCTHLGISRG